MKTNNRLPGSLKYSGDYQTEPIRIDVYDYDEKSWMHKTYESIDEIPLTKENTWINITGLHDVSLLEAIEKRFDINRFSLEDIVQVSTNTKIELFEAYTFSIFKMLYLKSKQVCHEHVAIIKKDKVLITFQETAGDVFDGIRQLIEKNVGEIRKRDIEFLYYKLLDALIDQYFEILPIINNRIEALEYEILEEKSATLDSIYLIKKELLLIKNSVMPLKLILQNYINKSDIVFQMHYSDLFDHLDQITENVTLNREIVSNLNDTLTTNLSHKMNRVMTTLTIFSAVFIPLSFFAGVFGMNFAHFPGLDYQYGLYMFILLCLVTSGGMIAFFKIKKIL